MFFIDLFFPPGRWFGGFFPKTLAQANPNASKRLPCGAGAGRVLCRSCLFVIETLHTQISALFLGKDGTALAYQVSGDYMRWLGYFLIFMGIKMATDGVLRGLRNYASVPRCKHGEPCDSSVRCPDLCTAFRHCLCLACCTSWLACKLFNLLCGSQEIMAD